MSEVDPVAVARLREMLAAVPALGARREAALRTDPPAPDSLAARDLAIDGGRFVSIFAGQALSGALDDLNAWRILVNGTELPIRAHLVLLRAALEASIRARWLVDPSVDAGERVGRAWAMRRHDQDERRKFEGSLPDHGAGLKASLGPRGRTGAERLAHLDDPETVKARAAAGIHPVEFLDHTAVSLRFDVEPAYRLLSGLAHGLEYAMHLMELNPLQGVVSTPGTSAGTFAMSERAALLMSAIALAEVRRAVDELEGYRLRPAPPPPAPVPGGRHAGELAEVKAWFGVRGLSVLIVEEDGAVWASLAAKRGGELVAPRYGRGSTPEEAAARARARYLEEQGTAT